ncbi:hypothetical protein [Paenibacillus sp. FSL H7-0331]|uniref:hypothetical protein n=1 Tax=Paenibacillus sp. FSL H7-0331 TaxID=1920421 RepID=UPI00096E961B|nr:hypothetical protein [Paenibacillus sp. FSL H7-0331]OME94511.1 hypothetical protein BK127_41470 [Paenibacillus sp. FSL H7-0331]
MTLLNDGEKVTILIDLLERHIDKLPSENSFANYLESIRGFLKTKDPILQKAAFSNSELFIDNFSYVLNNHITLKQAVGSLIAAFDKVGYADSMDAAVIIIKFEDLLKQMPVEDAENFYKERWITDKYRG